MGVSGGVVVIFWVVFIVFWKGLGCLILRKFVSVCMFLKLRCILLRCCWMFVIVCLSVFGELDVIL